jgi:hypothetical protein
MTTWAWIFGWSPLQRHVSQQREHFYSLGHLDPDGIASIRLEVAECHPAEGPDRARRSGIYLLLP